MRAARLSTLSRRRPMDTRYYRDRRRLCLSAGDSSIGLFASRQVAVHIDCGRFYYGAHSETVKPHHNP